MYLKGSNKLDKYLILEFRYRRKAALAYSRNHTIRQFIYTKISKYYENKHDKKLMSS